MKESTNYLMFYPVTRGNGDITFDIKSELGICLGNIAKNTGWGTYVYYPLPYTAIDRERLNEISTFMLSLENKENR
jgi:hypothetical protein